MGINISRVLHIPGEYSITLGNNEYSLIGVLEEKKDKKENIILLCNVNEDIWRFLEMGVEYQLYGRVAGEDITLYGSYLISEESQGVEVQCQFEPNELIIGGYYPNKVSISAIEVEITELNKMYGHSILNFQPSFSKQNPCVLSYVGENPIQATDKDGMLRIHRSLRFHQSLDGYSFEVVPNVDFIFNQPVTMHDAIRKISQITGLLSLFADHSITMSQFNIPDVRDSKNQEITTFDTQVYLNYAHRSDPLQHPYFLICTDSIRKSFQDIWNKWIDFYECSGHIVTLFLNVLLGYAKDTNLFLNLCQCLEVYSNRCRNEQAQAVRNIYPPDQYGKKKVTLKHRLEDLVSIAGKYVPIDHEKYGKIAQSVSNARNFFTHYNPSRPEPSYEYIHDAAIFLRAVLLIVIYERLGIDNNSIKKIRYYGYYRYLEDIICNISTT